MIIQFEIAVVLQTSDNNVHEVGGNRFRYGLRSVLGGGGGDILACVYRLGYLPYK